LPEGGIFQWHYPKDQQGLTDEAFVPAPVAAMGDRVLAPLAGEEGRRGLSCLPADVMQLDRPSPHWVYKTKNEVWRSSAVHDDSALLVDGKVGDEERFLHCVDMATGKRRWRAAVTSKACGRLVVAPDRIFIQDDESQLTCYDVEGEQKWSQRCSPLTIDPVVVAGALIVAEEPSVLVGVDPETGRSRWRLPLSAAVTVAPAAWKDTLYVGTETELAAFELNADDATPLWSRPCDGVTSDIAVTDEWIALVTRKSELILFKRGDGAEAARQAGALAVVAPVLDDEAVLFATANQICRLDLSEPDAEPSRWADLSWLGEPVTPMVYYRECLYVGIRGWGLVRFGDVGR
jgi:outer membrane protein assembly factor BamB